MSLSDELQRLADRNGNEPILCSRMHFREWADKARDLEQRLQSVQDELEHAVCTEGADKGVVMLSNEGRTHHETINGRSVTVYDNPYFSPLGDSLIKAWELARGK